MSVCPSVTREYSVETAKHIIKLFTPSGIANHFRFSVPKYMAIFWQRSPNGTRINGVWKIAIFDQYLALSRKRYKIELSLHLQWPNNRMWYMVCRTASFSMTLNDPKPRFQGHAILWRWMYQKQYERYSFNKILKGTYTRPSEGRHFKWPWVTLGDLAKYSLTQSIARSLCDSRASCCQPRR